VKNVDDVDRFTYLGSILACDGDAEADVNCRIGKAASAFDMDIISDQHGHKIV